MDDNNQPTGKIYTQSFINDIRNIPNFDEKLQYIKAKTSLFDHFQSKEDIITYARRKSKILIRSMTALASATGLNPIPFTDIIIVSSIQAGTIIRIGKYYGYVFKTISKSDLIAIYRGELYNPQNEENQNQVFRILTMEEIIKLIVETFFKGVLMVTAFSIDDCLKAFWGIGTIPGIILGAVIDGGIVFKYSKNSLNYFESKCMTDDGTIFFTTRCSEYEVIFRKFEQFKNFDLIYPSE